MRECFRCGERCHGCDYSDEPHLCPSCRSGLPPEEWLVYTLDEEGWGEVFLWWRPNSCGYTRFLGEAGRYSEEQAKSLTAGPHNKNACMPYSVALLASRTVVPLSDVRGVRKPADYRRELSEQRRNESAEWQDDD